MKKFLTALLSLSLIFISACSGNASVATGVASSNSEEAIQSSSSGSEEDNTTSEPTTDGSNDHSDTLVVYFSRTGEQYGVGVIDKGNTAIVAEMIAEKTGADLFEVLPEDDYYPYTYAELTDVAKQELNDNARPAYKGPVPDLSQYKTIFIGSPVWWGDWPMIMYTFFESNASDLAGKILIPFSTHAGSGLSGFDTKLAGACPNSTVGTGLAISGADAQNNKDKVKNDVDQWLSDLGY